MITKVEHVGYNHRSTPVKQLALDQFLRHELAVSAIVAKKQRRPWYVADMTAGPGHDDSGQDGSPLIFARRLVEWMAHGHQPVLLCAEQNGARLEILRARMEQRYPTLPVSYFLDQAALLAHIPRQAVGMTYWDPTRYNNLDKDLLTRFGRSHYLMDILITREGLTTKRMMHAGHCSDTSTIQDYLALTGKRENYIWEYAAYHWWCFGFADNYAGRDLRKMHGMVKVDSPDGRRIFQKWTVNEATEAEADSALPREVPLW